MQQCPRKVLIPNQRRTVCTITTNLQDDADLCVKWSKENNMSLNTKRKLELLAFLFKNPPEIPLIKINGKSTRRVNSAKLLGITVSSDLTWGNQINDIYTRAAQQLYSVIMLHRLGLLSQDKLDHYLCLIRPVVEYACRCGMAGLY